MFRRCLTLGRCLQHFQGRKWRMEGQGRYRCPDLLWFGDIRRRARYRMDRSIRLMTSEVNMKERKIERRDCMHSCFGSVWEADWTGGPCSTEHTSHLTISSSSLPSLILPPSIPFLLLCPLLPYSPHPSKFPDNTQRTIAKKCHETRIVQSSLR